MVRITTSNQKRKKKTGLLTTPRNMATYAGRTIMAHFPMTLTLKPQTTMKNKTNKDAQDTIQPQNPKDMNTRSIELMNNMHLFGMSEAYKTSLGSTFAENMTPDAFLFMSPKVTHFLL